MSAIDNRALQLGCRLARLLQALDPEPTAAPLLKLPIHTHDGVFAWDVELSEAAVAGLTRLLEAVEERQWSAQQPILRLVKR
ncbi:hypothetical protein ACFXGR_22480 [Streptomyces mirabilis]|uniref:hypothetical protein n=1 Tax=Streptomyces mirabilis TaxID=68239 RepID=UPI00367DABCD